jgi:membrane protein YdbS with pleckstrin-like domain
MRLVSNDPGTTVVNRYLLPDERNVIMLRQHPAKLLPPLTIAIGGLLAAIAVGTIPIDTESEFLAIWILAAFLVLRFIVDATRWALQYISLTEKRMLLISGVFSRKVVSIPLEKLDDMNFSRSPGGRLLGYGTFEIGLTGAANTIIDYIPYPEQFYLEVQGILHPEERRGRWTRRDQDRSDPESDD